jgi:hypothetical protein
VLIVTELRAGNRDGPDLALPPSLQSFAAGGGLVTDRRPFVRRGRMMWPAISAVGTENAGSRLLGAIVGKENDSATLAAALSLLRAVNGGIPNSAAISRVDGAVPLLSFSTASTVGNRGSATRSEWQNVLGVCTARP